jgi:hypothetical protein
MRWCAQSLPVVELGYDARQSLGEVFIWKLGAVYLHHSDDDWEVARPSDDLIELVGRRKHRRHAYAAILSPSEGACLFDKDADCYNIIDSDASGLVRSRSSRHRDRGEY